MLDLIKSRKSVRQYSQNHISDEDLRKILEAGRLAPSWMNVQPWEFILVKSEENKALLSELAVGQAHVKNADALILCIADTKQWDERKITGIKNPALNPALQNNDGIRTRSLEQVIFAVSYMMLEAEALGVSSCIIGALGNEITGVLPDVYAKVKQKLGLGDNHILSTIITLGYEKEKNEAPKSRRDFNDVVSLEKLGANF